MGRFAGRSRVVLWLPLAVCLLVASAAMAALGLASGGSLRRSGRLAGRALPAHLRQSPPRQPAGWIAAWSTSPQPATSRISFSRGFADQTVRNIVFTTAAGRVARVHFSNAFGRHALVIGHAALAAAGTGAGLVGRWNVPLTFAGRRTVVLGAGRSVVSDPVRLTVRPLERLAISVYLPARTGPPTDHGTAEQINYVAGGDHVRDRTPAAFSTHSTSWYFATGIDVWSPSPTRGTVVAFGDSITDGVGSGVDANARWPNDLARRIRSARGAGLSVVDAGVSGNRLLSRARCCGASGVARFASDVVRQPSVTAVIVLEGVNDLGATRYVSADQVIAGYERLIARAHAAGLEIFGATLTPFGGAGYWTPAGEAKREAINSWIRHSGAYDGVIDFASAVADPGDPTRLAPAYDSGDHLHPNAVGYRAMARAVNLSMLLRAARRTGCRASLGCAR